MCANPAANQDGRIAAGGRRCASAGRIHCRGLGFVRVALRHCICLLSTTPETNRSDGRSTARDPDSGFALPCAPESAFGRRSGYQASPSASYRSPMAYADRPIHAKEPSWPRSTILPTTSSPVSIGAACAVRSSPTARHDGVVVERGGRRLISFSCNDYLGLSTHPALAEPPATATRRNSAPGAGASRLVTGNHPLYDALEAARAPEGNGRGLRVRLRLSRQYRHRPGAGRQRTISWRSTSLPMPACGRGRG